MSAKEWLALNHYEDILETIAKLEKRWKSQGTGSRKSWWEILSGGKNGTPVTVDGEMFPVLRAAQVRLGKPVTKNAVWKKSEQPPPPKVVQARWTTTNQI